MRDTMFLAMYGWEGVREWMIGGFGFYVSNPLGIVSAAAGVQSDTRQYIINYVRHELFSLHMPRIVSC
jgi:hypothetical protein